MLLISPRFSKILFHIGKIYGNLCQNVIEEFIENGRLTVSDCLAEIEEHKDADMMQNSTEKEVLEAIATLIKGQYLLQVDRSSYSTEMYNLANAKPGYPLNNFSCLI
jgi:hypothetical protein